MRSPLSLFSPRAQPILILAFHAFILCLVLFLLSHHKSHTSQVIHSNDNLFVTRGFTGSLDNAVASNAALNIHVTEDYTCSASRPCSNKACCGASGNCGYGPDYCGDGCMSNCDAHAECGKYAEVKGKKCPLNVCCSEFGFCGTASDYCNDKCQSNCEEHPDPPPASGDGGGDILKRAIGYYEGWNAVSKCHETLPVDLPLSVLTHINFAFAFVDPETYAIVPMNDKMSTSLFTDTTNLKVLNPGLRVFISVGGWTFSDNGTVTQPLLGEISADAAKRAKFASQIVDFLTTYGFDGLDLDWEYPGAPDRGGKDEDTANMVLLFASIRSAFDKAKSGYELTFTIPASYWYLRWFDMPGLMKYADWTNLMSYDIHGVWDRENEIGNKVQPHTNLTEIKRATELLWRVGIPPDKVAVGFGFYGRSFTLEDPSCSKPGCPFSGGADPGVCTDTSSYLAYYEVQDILDKHSDIEVHHDEEAAVKYFSWGTDQWISYDDETTFKQKVEWANKIGLSGALIWAADLDDYEWSAHAGLFGEEIKPNNQVGNEALKDYALSQSSSLVTSELRNDCYLIKACVDRDIVTCGSGYSMVGYDKSDCGSGGSKPICCKTETKPTSCTWRGGGGDCNGQCHAGEVTLYDSKKGGGFESESGEKSCSRGHKVFCCQDHNFTELIDDCRWTDCGYKCNDDEIKVADAVSYPTSCNAFLPTQFCCKTKEPPLTNCHWVGQGDCADNTCNDREVTLATDTIGDGMPTSCTWGRRKALCCTPNLDAIKPTSCDNNTCWSDEDTDCAADTYADDFSDEDQCDPDDCFLDDKRTTSDDAHILVMAARRYPGPTHLHDPTNSTPASTNVFRMSGTTCYSTGIEVVNVSTLTNTELVNGYDTEHNPDLQYVAAFLLTAGSGILPDGSATNTTSIDPQILEYQWNRLSLDPADTRTGSSRGIRRPNDYFMDQFGSQGNRAPLLTLERQLNQIKGAQFTPKTPVRSERIMEDSIQEAINTGQGEEDMLLPLRQAIAVFRYINHADARPTIQANRRALRDAVEYISNQIPALSRLYDLLVEFDYNWYQTRTRRARTWVADQLVIIAAAFSAEERAGRSPTNIQAVRAAVESLFRDLSHMEPPPEDPDEP